MRWIGNQVRGPTLNSDLDEQTAGLSGPRRRGSQ
jgi:hypothetical protein